LDFTRFSGKFEHGIFEFPGVSPADSEHGNSAGSRSSERSPVWPEPLSARRLTTCSWRSTRAELSGAAIIWYGCVAQRFMAPTSRCRVLPESGTVDYSSMSCERKHRSSAVITSVMFIVPLLMSCAAQQPQSRLQSCTQAADEGVETRHAVVTMKELAEQEARNPPAARPPKAVHRPLPGPREGGERSSQRGDPCPGKATPSEHNVPPLPPAPEK